MKKLCLLLFIALFFNGFAQLDFSEKNVDLGVVPEAYEIKGNLIVKNLGAAKAFLMRADADNGVKIYTSKKTLQPGDTALLVISFIPESSGKFRKKINLVSSDKATPYELSLAGNLGKLKTDDKTACYYFGSKRPSPVAVNANPILVPNTTTPRDNSNKLPDNSALTPPAIRPNSAAAAPVTPKPVVPAAPKPTPKPVTQPAPTPEKDEFTETNYKPNNILFLVDVSSSMRDSLKLPLMKQALHTLIDAARNVDTITFITYAVKVNVLKEAVSGANKTTLHTLVDSLKAKGMTSGNKAILFSQQLAQKHFITGGNNQIILATDGEFKFTSEDQHLWKQHQLNKKIILSTIAFGSEKPAIKNLKDIASKGEGSFIHITTRSGADQKLLDEIKQRSRR